MWKRYLEQLDDGLHVEVIIGPWGQEGIPRDRTSKDGGTQLRDEQRYQRFVAIVCRRGKVQNVLPVNVPQLVKIHYSRIFVDILELELATSKIMGGKDDATSIKRHWLVPCQ